MQPLVSVIMGSTSDLPIIQHAAKQLEAPEVLFELLALSAHRIPNEIAQLARSAEERGARIIIAAADMATYPYGVITSMAILPVIGVPIDTFLEGLDVLLTIIQTPPDIPVVTIEISAVQNAALLVAQILAPGDPEVAQRARVQKASLKEKIVKTNKELAQIPGYKYKIN